MASVLQSWLRFVRPRSFFANFQSAATGGYGTALVNLIVRLFGTILSAMGFWWSSRTGGEDSGGGNATLTR